MKFLSTTLLLALASVAAGNRDWSKVEEHAQNTDPDTVQSRENVKVKCKDMFMIPRSLGAGKPVVMIPRKNEIAESKSNTCSRRVRERRHLEDGVSVEGPEKNAVYKTSTTIPFTFTGLPANARSIKLVFTHSDGSAETIDIDSFKSYGIEVDEGVLEIISNPSDSKPGVYKYKLTYMSGNDAETVNGEYDFTWGEVLRRSGAGSTSIVGEAEYPYGGQIQGTSGRIYYSSFGVDYACSGTVVKDNKTGRTLILTAAHCVWDDIDEVWGSNVIFIPNRDAVDDEGLTASEIHRECENDICGCWYVDGGVVHDKWRDTPWPARLDYDYGFWIVADEWAHVGNFCGSEALDVAVEPMTFGVGIDLEGEHVTGLGYSVEYNPDFRYCADTIEYNQPTSGTDTYWLPGCGLTGGASGGPWLLDFDSDDGSGTVVSVNSWSYSDVPGMGGPIIDESEARCLINAARDIDNFELYDRDEGEQGEFINCYDRPCIPEDEDTERKLRGNRRLCEN